MGPGQSLIGRRKWLLFQKGYGTHPEMLYAGDVPGKHHAQPDHQKAGSD